MLKTETLLALDVSITGQPRHTEMAKFVLLFAMLSFSSLALAQDNYEIQVYGSETVPENSTMFELHSNWTADGSNASAGSRYASDGTVPTQHALHETLEITNGWTNWFETGFYIFTSENPGFGYNFVGSHIRPRVRAPESWHLPVGLSLSLEAGYQRPRFSPDTWTLEIRPIIDKKVGRTYLAFNPTLDRSWHGPSVSKGVEFSPNAKISYDILRWRKKARLDTLSVGVEYYGSCGPITGFDPLRQQQQQFFPSLDLDVSENWEFNFGVGIGTTVSTDRLIYKAILGRRFDWKRKQGSKP
jgi:hypothetical protein